MAHEVSDHDKTSSYHDSVHLADRRHHHHSVGAVLRPRSHLRRPPRHPAVHRSLARLPRRLTLLPGVQPAILLHPAADTDLHVLHPDLGARVQTSHPQRHQGCSDGTDAAEVQGQGCQDAGRRRHLVCSLLAAAVRHLRQDKARGRDHRLGGGRSHRHHPNRPVAGGLQLLHQPHLVRFLQQQVSQGLHGDSQEPAVLQHSALLRRGRHGKLVLRQHAQVLVLRDQ